MPKCKNDPSRNYKGDEPSPKGLGHCAHAEKLGTEMKGKDGNMWKVTETKTGSKRWNKFSNNTKVKRYEIDDSGFVFGDWKPLAVTIDGNKLNVFTINDSKLRELNNFENKQRQIKARIKFGEILDEVEKNPFKYYTKKVKTYNAEKILITKQNGKEDSVSILIRLDKEKYVIISERTMKNVKIDDDVITELKDANPRGRYPLLAGFGKKYIYFLGTDGNSSRKISREKIPKKISLEELRTVYWLKELPDGSKAKLQKI